MREPSRVALPGRAQAMGVPARALVGTGLDQRVVLAPGDGSLGPLLRVADDRLAPGAGYGRHDHRAVDVLAVVLAGSLQHLGGEVAGLAAGDVGVLRAGTGLEHDEAAGPDGAWVLQSYLRAGDPAAPPSHAVHVQPTGWLDLGRPDARLWLARLAAGETAQVPAGLLVVADADGVRLGSGRTVRARGPTFALVWQLDRGRPIWAGA